MSELPAIHSVTLDTFNAGRRSDLSLLEVTSISLQSTPAVHLQAPLSESLQNDAVIGTESKKLCLAPKDPFDGKDM